MIFHFLCFVGVVFKIALTIIIMAAIAQSFHDEPNTSLADKIKVTFVAGLIILVIWLPLPSM